MPVRSCRSFSYMRYGQPPAVAMGPSPWQRGRPLPKLVQAVITGTRSRIMKFPPTPQQAAAEYELRFQSLFDEGRAYAFPCDARGHVVMDALSDRARQTYLYARALIGLEVAMPAVRV